MQIESIRTVGELRAAGYHSRSVKEEMRENALRMLRAGEDLFPGIIGYERTVIPQLLNAVLSKHDFILLGLRGQAKTRLVRGLVGFLDEQLPALAGAPLAEDPFKPVTAAGKRIIREAGDSAPIHWIPRADRFHEKLATPDVTIADLIGDVDPIKAAHEGRTLDDEEIIQFGLVARAHRGIFALNELPDLAPRIQVGLLNIMEEKDVQIRGFPLRLSLELAMVFTANPEDYTNRGSIITPLKDRIGSQIHTHYPTDLLHAMEITEQEAWTHRGQELHLSPFLRRVVDEVVFLARGSDFVDSASGVSARASISAYENLISNVERRWVTHPAEPPIARVCDLDAMIPALVGKVELAYEGEEEGVTVVVRDLLGKAVKRAFLDGLPDPKAPSGRNEANALEGRNPQDAPEVDRSMYGSIVTFFSNQGRVEVSDSQSNAEYRQALSQVTGLRNLVEEHLPDLEEADLYCAMEMVLEGLYQSSFVAKENLDQSTLYSDMLMRMFEGMGQTSDD